MFVKNTSKLAVLAAVLVPCLGTLAVHAEEQPDNIVQCSQLNRFAPIEGDSCRTSARVAFTLIKRPEDKGGTYLWRNERTKEIWTSILRDRKSMVDSMEWCASHLPSPEAPGAPKAQTTFRIPSFKDFIAAEADGLREAIEYAPISVSLWTSDTAPSTPPPGVDRMTFEFDTGKFARAGFMESRSFVCARGAGQTAHTDL